MARGLIRHVDAATYLEDPLRVLRAAQFSARLGFRVAEETIRLCSRMDLTALEAFASAAAVVLIASMLVSASAGSSAPRCFLISVYAARYFHGSLYTFTSA